MNILIFGASGATGNQLVKQAIEKGHYVTAFVRPQSKFEINDGRLRVIRGDLHNVRQLTAAMEGQDAVLSALGATSPFRYDQSLIDGFKTIIGCMKICGVNRFVYMSFMGVRDSRSQAGFVVKYLAPLILATEIRGHETREQMIVESNLSWTIVRPPTLTNGKLSRRYRAGENLLSTSFAATISRADVADFMLNQIGTIEFVFSKPAVLHY